MALSSHFISQKSKGVGLEPLRTWLDPIFNRRTPREPTAPVITRPTAYIEWGGPTGFEHNFRDEARGIGFRGDPDEETYPRLRIFMRELGRSTKDIVCFSVESPDTYITVRCAQQIEYVYDHCEGGAPQEEIEVQKNPPHFIFKMRPLPPNVYTGSGQDPPAPPDLANIEG